jgi:hypothetical protein
MTFPRTNRTRLVLKEASTYLPESPDHILYHMKAAFLKRAYKIVSPAAIARLEQAGVTLNDVKIALQIYYENISLLQQYIATRYIHDNNLSSNILVNDLNQIISDKKFPSTVNGTLEEKLYYAGISNLETTVVFDPTRLDMLAELIKLNITPQTASVLIIRNSLILPKMLRKITHIKDTLYYLAAEIITKEQENNLENVKAELINMQQGKPSKFDHSYGGVIKSLTQSTPQDTNGISLAELIAAFFSYPALHELEARAIRIKEQMVDDLLYEIVGLQIKLGPERLPTQLSGNNAEEMYNLKMQLVRSQVVAPWIANHTDYVPPVAVCPAIVPYPSMDEQFTAVMTAPRQIQYMAQRDSENYNRGLLYGAGIVLSAWVLNKILPPVYNHAIQPAVKSLIDACCSCGQLLFASNRNDASNTLLSIQATDETKNIKSI